MSKTKENLAAAFAGESQARNKYTYYAKIAHKEGYHYIGKLFEETADNEKVHAKEEFKLLNGIGDTAANLQEAINGEHYETIEMYPTFAKEAEAERERRAVIIRAEGEVMAAENMTKAASMLASAEGALHLRTLQSVNDLSSDQSNTTIWMMPIEILRAVESWKKSLEK